MDVFTESSPRRTEKWNARHRTTGRKEGVQSPTEFSQIYLHIDLCMCVCTRLHVTAGLWIAEDTAYRCGMRPRPGWTLICRWVTAEHSSGSVCLFFTVSKKKQRKVNTEANIIPGINILTWDYATVFWVVVIRMTSSLFLHYTVFCWTLLFWLIFSHFVA